MRRRRYLYVLVAAVFLEREISAATAAGISAVSGAYKSSLCFAGRTCASFRNAVRDERPSTYMKFHCQLRSSSQSLYFWHKSRASFKPWKTAHRSEPPFILCRLQHIFSEEGNKIWRNCIIELSSQLAKLKSFFVLSFMTTLATSEVVNGLQVPWSLIRNYN